MKKGFTLIELLAVIVILAIIALIATPIVLSIIEETKESAVLRSAEHYLNTVELGVAKKNLNAGGSFSPNTCIVQSNGNLLCDGKDELVVELSGEAPSGGTITFNKGKIVDATLALSNKTIVKNNEGKLVFEETPTFEKGKFSSVCKIAEDSPVEGTNAGAKYTCEVKEGTSYTFYVLTTPQEGDTSINLIMDRNICEDGTPTEEGKTCLVAYNSSGNASGTGPVTVMTYLNNATSTWENIDNLDLTYDDEGENFTDFALNGKARLPYYSEVSGYSTSANNAYLYDNLNLGCWDDDWEDPVSCDVSNNIDGLYIEGIGHISEIDGYWTLSSLADYSSRAWYVYYGGSVGYIIVSSDDNYGARAVINLKL